MAIDYVIDYACTPKAELGTDGILLRLKGRDQANAIIQMYRREGDDRPIDQMGFEFSRRSAGGEEETQLILVKDLVTTAQELDPLAQHCAGCPANLLGVPFGCFGKINYPISEAAENWLLAQLPTPSDAVLPHTLLGQSLRDLNLSSEPVADLRKNGTYFVSPAVPRRLLGEFAVNGNNVFYMLFLMGHLEPSRIGVLLLLFNAIPRNIDASDMMKLTPAAADADTRYPFLHQPGPDDDPSVEEFKRFFHALYAAWRLHVRVLLDV